MIQQNLASQKEKKKNHWNSILAICPSVREAENAVIREDNLAKKWILTLLMKAQ